MHLSHIYLVNQNTGSPTWKVFSYNPQSTCSKCVIKLSLKSGLAMGPDLPNVLMFTLQAAGPTTYLPSNLPTWDVHSGVHWLSWWGHSRDVAFSSGSSYMHCLQNSLDSHSFKKDEKHLFWDTSFSPPTESCNSRRPFLVNKIPVPPLLQHRVQLNCL